MSLHKILITRRANATHVSERGDANLKPTFKILRKQTVTPSIPSTRWSSDNKPVCQRCVAVKRWWLQSGNHMSQRHSEMSGLVSPLERSWLRKSDKWTNLQLFFPPQDRHRWSPYWQDQDFFPCCMLLFPQFFFLYDIGGKKYLLIIWRHILKFKKKNHQQEGKVTELEAMEKEMVNSSMGVSRMVRVRMMASEGQLVWTCPEHDLQRHHLTDAEVGN